MSVLTENETALWGGCSFSRDLLDSLDRILQRQFETRVGNEYYSLIVNLTEEKKKYIFD